MELLTYKDLVDHAIEYLGSSTDATSERTARNAVQSAYANLSNERRWTYFYQTGRVTTVAPYTTGTIAYDHTGGAYERVVTLASGTWPSWSANGALVIGTTVYQVAERKSDTEITLSVSSNPGEDVAAATTYTIYRDTYPLPCDFGSIAEVMNMGNSLCLQYVHPAEWLAPQRIYQGSAQPSRYTITGDPNLFGVLALRLYPFPDAAYALDFLYTRRPRALKVIGETTGTVTTASGSTTVSGSGTAFTSSMVGSIIRFANSTTILPTGRSGDSPFEIERTVIAVASTTAMTIDSDPAQNLTGVKFVISDPVDVEPGAMANFLKREVERQVRIIKRMKAMMDEERQHAEARILAFEGDSRNFDSRGPGGRGYGWRMADMPSGADQG